MNRVLLSRWACRVSSQGVPQVRSIRNCSHLVWQKSESRARNSSAGRDHVPHAQWLQRSSQPLDALISFFSVAHSPVNGGRHTTPCLSVSSWVCLAPSTYCLYSIPPPGSHTSSSLLYKLIFKNLACKSFCLKDKEFTLTAPHAWRKFFSLLLQPLVIPPTDSWPVWCQPLPRLFSLFISKSAWGDGHQSSDTSWFIGLHHPILMNKELLTGGSVKPFFNLRYRISTDGSNHTW